MIAITTTLALLLFGATFSIVHDVCKVYRLRRAKKHDWILYRFCRVRDAFAELAIDGKISEDSRIFKFFYLNNADLIHTHRTAGTCFSNLLRVVDRQVEPSTPDEKQWMESLFQEIHDSEKAVRSIVAIYDRALFEAIISSLHLIMVDRIIRSKPLRQLKLNPERIVLSIAKSLFSPTWLKQSTSFWERLRDSAEQGVPSNHAIA